MSALVADYERLVMMQHCLAQGLDARVAFEVHVRRLPPGTDHLVAAGLEQVLQYLKSFSFSEAEQAWLDEAAPLSPQFLAQARALRFDGDVDAMPEGSIFFADEPLLRVTAALPLAQYLETRVLNLLQYEVSVCSWASRLVAAAEGRPLVDAAHRHAHGPESALLASRACYLAGFEGTSSADACRRFRIPLCRTLTVCRPGTAPVDPDALGSVVYGPSLPYAEIDFVRLVGADLPGQATEMRRLLDAQGLQRVRILACGEFDADHIAALTASGAPLDAYGPASVLSRGRDLLAADLVYALPPHARGAAPTQAAAAAGRQVWREHAADGTVLRDTVTLADEPAPRGARPLLQPFMQGGRRLARATTLEESRAHHAAQRASLPAGGVEVVRSARLAAATPPDPSTNDLRADPRPD